MQGLIFNEVQALLAKPNIHTCTARWILKCKREEEELEIRNICSRLDTINAGLELHGISFQIFLGNIKLINLNSTQHEPTYSKSSA